MRSEILRRHIATLQLRSDAPWPSQAKDRNRELVRLRLVYGSSDYRRRVIDATELSLDAWTANSSITVGRVIALPAPVARVRVRPCAIVL
jgi:hypothetical protein